jgi:LuxR family transcriptional regulator, maltose regulon positive regulatory protein
MTAPRAQTAACTAADAAHDVGLGAYHGVATAYAVRARTTADPARAHADALLAVSLAKRASTDLSLGYVLAVCGDTLTDLGDPAGRAADHRSPRRPRPVPGPRHSRSVPEPGRVPSRHGGAEQHRGVRARPAPDRAGARRPAIPTRRTHVAQRDIASELYVSLNTVKTHCKAIYHKLGVVDRKGAVQAARDVHLL